MCEAIAPYLSQIPCYFGICSLICLFYFSVFYIQIHFLSKMGDIKILTDFDFIISECN